MARVLLIEPDAVLASTYTAVLRQAGHDVSVTAGAQAAIDFIDARQPDIILLELQLPGHNGVEFLFELRSYPEWQAIPIIILSHIPPSKLGVSQTTWSRLGITAYHYKPRTTLAEMVEAINNVIPTLEPESIHGS